MLSYLSSQCTPDGRIVGARPAVGAKAVSAGGRWLYMLLPKPGSGRCGGSSRRPNAAEDRSLARPGMEERTCRNSSHLRTLCRQQ